MPGISQKNSNVPELSNLEGEVMGVLWEKKKATSRDIKQALEPQRPLALTTILTILTRLQKKGYIMEVPSLGRSLMFAPAVPQRTVIVKNIRSLLKQFFSGSPSSLVTHLLENENIPETELAEIRRLLNVKLQSLKRRT